MVVFGIAHLHQFGHLRITDSNRINADEQMSKLYTNYISVRDTLFVLPVQVWIESVSFTLRVDIFVSPDI